MGRASLGSATEGSAATGGDGAGAREGGRFSCPLSPEQRRLSAPLDAVRGGEVFPTQGRVLCTRPHRAGGLGVQ